MQSWARVLSRSSLDLLGHGDYTGLIGEACYRHQAPLIVLPPAMQAAAMR